MDVFKDLEPKEQSRIMRVFLKKHRWHRGLLEAEKERHNIKDIKQQQYISNLQTHVDIMSLAMQDLELIERYVIEQAYYNGIKQKFIAERLNIETRDVSKINSKALKKIRSNLCNMSIGVTNKDNIKNEVF